MRRWIAGLVLGLGMSGAVWAQDMPGTEIEGVITRQMEAFRAQDLSGAFGFASPNLQMMFGSPDRFGAMVRNGYPMVWQPGDVRFGELREIDGALWQKVIVQDAEGRSHVLDYRMERTVAGWRISAVQVLPAPDVAA